MVKNMETKIKMNQDTPFNGLTISLKPEDIATKMDLDKLEEQLEKNFDLKISIITKTLEAIPVCGKINVHTIAAQKYTTPQAA